jgi:hypothetical protein
MPDITLALRKFHHSRVRKDRNHMVERHGLCAGDPSYRRTCDASGEALERQASGLKPVVEIERRRRVSVAIAMEKMRELGLPLGHAEA